MVKHVYQKDKKYDFESAQDIQDALKDLLGGTIKELMEAEMDEHLGYSKSERSDSDDYRNGYNTLVFPAPYVTALSLLLTGNQKHSSMIRLL